MKLYVGNLAFSTQEEEVRRLFEQAGEVRGCELVSDKFTGKSRGFAFVEMQTPEEGTQAIQRFHDFELDGRRMIVNEARPREARAGGFEAPGGGGFGAPAGGRGAGGAGVGPRHKSGKGSRRNARSAKRERKACW